MCLPPWGLTATHPRNRRCPPPLWTESAGTKTPGVYPFMADDEIEVTFRVPLEVARSVQHLTGGDTRSSWVHEAGDLDSPFRCARGRAMLALLDAELPEPVEIEQGDEVRIAGSPWASVPVRWVEDDEIVVVHPIGGLGIYPLSAATLVAKAGAA